MTHDDYKVDDILNAVAEMLRDPTTIVTFNQTMKDAPKVQDRTTTETITIARTKPSPIF